MERQLLTRQEIQKRYYEKNAEKIKQQRKRVEVVCPDCNEKREVRADQKRKTDRCNVCSIRHIRTEEGDELHGLSTHPLYIRWTGMRRRVNDPAKRNSYLDKGVVVCDEWKASFLVFYDWANANGYESHLELDRIDNSGNYSPENCRWITHQENCCNKG
jgi:hypothetical protein